MVFSEEVASCFISFFHWICYIFLYVVHTIIIIIIIIFPLDVYMVVLSVYSFLLVRFKYYSLQLKIFHTLCHSDGLIFLCRSARAFLRTLGLCLIFTVRL